MVLTSTCTGSKYLVQQYFDVGIAGYLVLLIVYLVYYCNSSDNALEDKVYAVYPGSWYDGVE